MVPEDFFQIHKTLTTLSLSSDSSFINWNLTTSSLLHPCKYCTALSARSQVKYLFITSFKLSPVYHYLKKVVSQNFQSLIGLKKQTDCNSVGYFSQHRIEYLDTTSKQSLLEPLNTYIIILHSLLKLAKQHNTDSIQNICVCEHMHCLCIKCGEVCLKVQSVKNNSGSKCIFFMSDEERMIHIVKMRRLGLKSSFIEVVGGWEFMIQDLQ